MNDADDAGPAPGDRYAPDEIEGFRAQIRRGNADARAELDRRGHRGPHPRVKALMDAGLWPTDAHRKAAGGSAPDGN